MRLIDADKLLATIETSAALIEEQLKVKDIPETEFILGTIRALGKMVERAESVDAIPADNYKDK